MVESATGMLKTETETENCIIDAREDLSRREAYHLKRICRMCVDKLKLIWI